MAPAQGIPFDHQDLVVGGWRRSLYSSVSRDYNNQRDISWQISTHGTLHRWQTETHPQTFCRRDLLASSGVSDIRADYRLGTHLKAMEVLSGNTGLGMPSLPSPSDSLQLIVVSQKRTCILIWSQYYCHCYQGIYPDHRAQELSRTYNCSPTV